MTRSADPARRIAVCRALCLLFAAGLWHAPVPAQEERRPAPVMPPSGADYLERSSRDEEQKPDEVIRTMALKYGDIVADVGAGTGYFTRRLAKAVGPSGRVYAVDIQPEML